MRVQLRQVEAEDLVVSAVVRLHLVLVQAERGHVQGTVEDVREADESVVLLHV